MRLDETSLDIEDMVTEDDEKIEMLNKMFEAAIGGEPKTDSGKQLKIATDSFGAIYFRFTDGGEVPHKIKGKYTSIRNAASAFKDYLATAKNSKVKVTNEPEEDSGIIDKVKKKISK